MRETFPRVFHDICRYVSCFVRMWATFCFFFLTFYINNSILLLFKYSASFFKSSSHFSFFNFVIQLKCILRSTKSTRFVFLRDLLQCSHFITILLLQYTFGRPYYELKILIPFWFPVCLSIPKMSKMKTTFGKTLAAIVEFTVL